MSEYVKSVEQLCSPIQLVTGLGFEPKKSGDQYTIICPCCRNRLFILKTGFLCENSECDFRAGGIYDLLKKSENLKTYEAALLRLEHIFPDFFADQIFLKDAKNRQRVIKQLEARRRMYNLLQRQARESIDDHHTLSIHSKLRVMSGLDNISSPYCIFPLSKHNYEELETTLRMYGHGCPDFRDSKPILIPYFINHHTVGALGYKYSLRSATHFLKLESRKFQYCGLMQADPRIKKFTLVPTYAKILSKNEEFIQTDPGNLALHLLRDKSSALDPDWTPESAVYVEQRVNEWANLLMFARHTKVFVSRSSHITETPINLQERILNHLLQRLKETGFDGEVELLLEQGQLFPEFVPELRARLEQDSQWELLRDLNKFLATKVLDITPDGDKLSQKDGGYYFTRKDGNEINLSNFVIDFHKSVRFYNNKDVYHEIDLSFADRKIPMLLAHQDLHNPRKMLESLQQFPQDYVDLKQLEGIPILTETSGKQIHALMRYLKSRPGFLPVVEGIPALGWSSDRKYFFGPSWIASADKIKYEDMIHHPDNPVLKNFNSKVHEVRNINLQIPIECSTLIAQAVAMIFRAFHGVDPIAIAFLRDGGGERLLREMFSAIGQTQPIHMNESQWSRGGGLDTHGFPVYGVGASYWKTQKLKNSVFMLTDRGIRIDDDLDDESYDLSKQSFRQIIHKSLQWILSDQNTEFKYQRSVDPAFVLSKEGHWVIEQATDMEWSIRTPAYNVLDTIFGSIPFEETREYLINDLNRQRVELKLEGLPDVNRTDLQIELGQYASDVQLTETGIEAKDIDMKTLVETYYQDTPVFEEVFVAPDM